MNTPNLLDHLPPAMKAVPKLRYWGDRTPPKNRTEMFSVVTNATEQAAGEGDAAPSGDGPIATLRMYGPIDSWGGFWGISAKDVAQALDSLGDGVSEIRVRINSPGGECWEGMAILNMLRAHSAKVVAVVDGLAASAASFIASGCDETVMSPGTQMMIHDASGFAYGNEETMLKAARFLASTSNAIASIYAETTGESDAEWRAAMVAETWYTAAEAVDAGLADRVAVVPDVGKTTTAGEEEPPAMPDPSEVEDMFDLSMYKHPGRSHAPAPAASAAPHAPVAVPAPGSTTAGEEHAVAFSDEQLTTMRQELGLPADADEGTIVSAMQEALREQADPAAGDPTPPGPAPAAPAAPAPAEPAASTRQHQLPAGAVVLDAATLESLQAQGRKSDAVYAQMAAQERDTTIHAAVYDDKKFPPSEIAKWKKSWDLNPDGTKATIAQMPKDLIPTAMIGVPGDPDGFVDGEFDPLFSQPAGGGSR